LSAVALAWAVERHGRDHGFSGSEAARPCGDSAGHGTGAHSQTRSPKRGYRHSHTRSLRSACSTITQIR
jgi:hypothetical protein